MHLVTLEWSVCELLPPPASLSRIRMSMALLYSAFVQEGICI